MYLKQPISHEGLFSHFVEKVDDQSYLNPPQNFILNSFNWDVFLLCNPNIMIRGVILMMTSQIMNEMKIDDDNLCNGYVIYQRM